MLNDSPSLKLFEWLQWLQWLIFSVSFVLFARVGVLLILKWFYCPVWKRKYDFNQVAFKPKWCISLWTVTNILAFLTSISDACTVCEHLMKGLKTMAIGTLDIDDKKYSSSGGSVLFLPSQCALKTKANSGIFKVLFLTQGKINDEFSSKFTSLWKMFEYFLKIMYW